MQSAISLLETGLTLNPGGEAGIEMRKMLAEAQSALPGTRRSAEVREILDRASKDLDAALQELNKSPSSEAIRKTAEAAARAVAAGERAHQKASRGGDAELLRQVDTVLADFRVRGAAA